MKQIFLPLTLLFLVIVSNVSAQDKTEYNNFSLHDPFSFRTAAEMYRVADTLPYSSKMDPIIDVITKNINNGTFIENTIIWTQLQKLEPYRMHPKVQESVKKWVEKTTETILKKNNSQMVSVATLKLICSYYKSNNFSRTVQESLKELQKDPESPDLRNNLALALIHQNKDLCAQIELEILNKLFDSYPAGLINLIVVYERMNRSDEAEALAKKLYLLQYDNNIDIPEARFNAAWLMNKKGDYDGADYILNNPKILTSNTITKYDSLRILNLKQFEQELNK